MKKKLLAMLMISAIGMSTLVGCSGKGGEVSQTTSNGKVELDFFQMKNEAKEVYDQIIQKFQEENPNIVINQISPADSEAVFLSNIATGDIPDIMSIFPAETTYKNIIDEGIIAEMTGEKILENAEEAAVEFTKHNGKVYAMPFARSSYGIFCNEDMFKKQGLALPTTYEELISVCKNFKTVGIEAIAFNDKDAIALGQEAERIIGVIKNDVYKDFETVGTTEASFKDMDYIKRMAEVMLELRSYGPKDTLAIGREQATADFVNGKHPMFVSGTWGLAAIMKAAPEMNVTMIPIPNPYQNGETTIPINIDIAIGYAADTEYKEEALKFIEFCARPEINQLLADQEGTPTVIKGVNYNIKPLKFMKEQMDIATNFLTLVNFWPAGMRNEWAIPMQQLLIDKDIDKFIGQTDKIVKQYYTKNK